MTWTIGAAKVERVEEQAIDVPIALISGDRELVDHGLEHWPSDMIDPANETFRLVTQSWILRVDGLTIIVDPCNGNGRRRPGFPHFEDLDVPWLARVAEIGVDPQDVDIVFCTHLHCDHCGWNTRLQDGLWIPTFPNARYVLLRREVERWDTSRADRPDEPDYNRDVFEESVRPVIEAGLAEQIDAPHQLSPSLRIEAATGHTEGHAVLRLESEGAIAWFAGDVVHHPIQVLDPALHMPGCEDLPTAIATRQRLLTRIRDEAAWLIPAHFGAPHHGRVVERDDGGLLFLPGGL